jgi:hypothetical protein
VLQNRQYSCWTQSTKLDILSSGGSVCAIPYLEGRSIDLGYLATSSFSNSLSFFCISSTPLIPDSSRIWQHNRVSQCVLRQQRHNTSPATLLLSDTYHPPTSRFLRIDQAPGWSVCRRNYCNTYVACSVAAIYLVFLLSTISAGQLRDRTSIIQFMSPFRRQSQWKLVLSAVMMC